MPSLEIHPLSGLRNEAAALLAERFVRQREAEPLLPEIDDFEPHVPEEGLVATRGGEVVGYLAGVVENGIAQVGFGGCAASEPQALGHLFAESAQVWDVSRFAVAVPASADGLIAVFFRLAFGCQLVWAVRELDVSGDGAVQLHRCRFGTPDDLEEALALDRSFVHHSHGSPSLSDLRQPSDEDMRKEWAETWKDPRFVHFVAEQAGDVTGQLLMYRRPRGDLRVPDSSIDIALSTTAEDARGTGVGLALFAHAVAWAKSEGFHALTVDWRTVNLLADRFWTHRGFRPQYLRLYRAVP